MRKHWWLTSPGIGQRRSWRPPQDGGVFPTASRHLRAAGHTGLSMETWRQKNKNKTVTPQILCFWFDSHFGWLVGISLYFYLNNIYNCHVIQPATCWLPGQNFCSLTGSMQFKFTTLWRLMAPSLPKWFKRTKKLKRKTEATGFNKKSQFGNWKHKIVVCFAWCETKVAMAPLRKL